jgi:hypothetical protein
MLPEAFAGCKAEKEARTEERDQEKKREEQKKTTTRQDF